MQRKTTRLKRGLFVERDLGRLKALLDRFKAQVTRRPTGAALTAFDQAAETTLSEIFGDATEFMEAYQYAKVGEAASLINLPEEAQEAGALDMERESLQQRRQVIESAIAELQRVGGNNKKSRKKTTTVRVADYMSADVRSIRADATVKEAGRLLQKLKVGSLLVDDGRRYIGIITDTDLSRKAVARGLDPNTTAVKSCMSKPIISIEDDEPLDAAVKMMKDNGVRHLAITEDRTIIGVLSVSDLLRYYSNIT